jgi:hypothetical protein
MQHTTRSSLRPVPVAAQSAAARLLALARAWQQQPLTVAVLRMRPRCAYRETRLRANGRSVWQVGEVARDVFEKALRAPIYDCDSEHARERKPNMTFRSASDAWKARSFCFGCAVPLTPGRSACLLLGVGCAGARPAVLAQGFRTSNVGWGCENARSRAELWSRSLRPCVPASLGVCCSAARPSASGANECARAYPRRHGYPAHSWYPKALRSNDGGGKAGMRTSVDSFQSVCQLHSVNRNWQTGAVGRRVRMSHATHHGAHGRWMGSREKSLVPVTP